MFALKFLSASILAVLVAGCGGGGSSVAPSTAPSNQPVPVVQVAAYGDSTQAAQGQPHAASREAFTVRNEGVSGSYTQQLLDGTDGVHKPWSQEMAQSTASIVVVNHGINDWRYPIAQYRANLRELVRVAREHKKLIVLEVPNQTTTPESDTVRQAMRDTAAEVGAYLCEQPPVPLSDWAHPTSEGYAKKATRLSKCLGDLVGAV